MIVSVISSVFTHKNSSVVPGSGVWTKMNNAGMKSVQLSGGHEVNVEHRDA